jgi:hypothetical protein
VAHPFYRCPSTVGESRKIELIARKFNISEHHHDVHSIGLYNREHLSRQDPLEHPSGLSSVTAVSLTETGIAVAEDTAKLRTIKPSANLNCILSCCVGDDSKLQAIRRKYTLAAI